MALANQFSLLSDEEEMLGKEFTSWKALTFFIDEWCEQRTTILYMRNAVLLTKNECANRMRPDTIAVLKYKYIRFICKKGVQQRFPTTLCPANITLRLNGKLDRLVVSKCSFKHNHALCPCEFANHFKKGLLLANSYLPVRITNGMCKQFVVMKDIQNLLAICHTEENGILDMFKTLENLFVHDPEAKVKLVFVEDCCMVRTVFLMTSLMRSLCQRFPETLVFDCMVGLDEVYDLFVLLCVDNEGRGQECAYCLTRKGTTDLLRFTMVSFAQSVPDVKLKVKCVTVGLDIWDEKAVTELLPNAQVQIAQPQVTLFNKAQEMGAPEDKHIWPLLCELVSSRSPEAYTSILKEMEAIFPEKFMKYFQEHWHPLRKMWVDCWTFKATQDTSANELIRQLQQQLVSSLRPSPSLGQGLVDLLTLQISRAKDLTDEDVVTSYQIFYNVGQVKLIRKELALARNGNYNIQGAMYGFSINDGGSDYSMDHKLTTCSCSISIDSCVPCQHLFITRIQLGEALFNTNLLRKNAVPIYTRTENVNLSSTTYPPFS